MKLGNVRLGDRVALIGKNAKSVEFTLKNDTLYLFNGRIRIQLKNSVLRTSVTLSEVVVNNITYAGDIDVLEVQPGEVLEFTKFPYIPEATVVSYSYYYRFVLYDDYNNALDAFDTPTFLIDSEDDGISVTSQLKSFRLESTDCSIIGQAISGKILYAQDVTHAKAYFEFVGKYVKVGAEIQESGITTNDFSSPVTYRVFSNSLSLVTEYVVTLIRGPLNAKEIHIFSSGSSVVTPAYVGKRMDYSLRVQTFGEEDYLGTEGYEVEVSLQKAGTDQIIGLPSLPINIPIPSKGYFLLTDSWIVPYSLKWGATEGNYILRFRFPSTAYPSLVVTKNVTILKKANMANTIVFNEKLGVFSGSRTNISPFYVAINNDLYSVYREDLQMNKFYLQDQSTSSTEFGLPIKWSISFYLNAGIDVVYFKNLQIELGKILDGSPAYLDTIEYQTARQKVVQDPFYSATDLSWKPVWKDNKWHLPIKNEYDSQAIIKNKKLKGTYLQLTFKGSNADPIFLRSILTRISKSFS